MGTLLTLYVTLGLSGFLPSLKPGVVWPSSVTRVSQLFDHQAHSWSSPLLSQLFTSDSVEAIHRLPKLSPALEDRKIWALSSKGSFSVKSAYGSLRDWSHYNRMGWSDKDWSLLWQLKVQDRLKVFLWRVIHAAFPFHGVVSQLYGHHMEDNGLCPLCSLAPESALHLFMFCRAAKTLRRESFWPIIINNLSFTSIAAFIKWIVCSKRAFLHSPVEHRNYVLHAAIVLDSIWYAWNSVIHQDWFVTMHELIGSVKRRYLDHLQAWSDIRVPVCSGWLPPAEGRWKCNVDVAVRVPFSALAVSFRDHLGSLCMTNTERLSCQDPLEGGGSCFGYSDRSCVTELLAYRFF